MFQQTSSVLMIDLAEVTEARQLHELLARVFVFPDSYGRNWDDFDKCIRDVKLPSEVQISGLEALRVRFPREAAFLETRIQSFVAESSRRHVRFIEAPQRSQGDSVGK